MQHLDLTYGYTSMKKPFILFLLLSLTFNILAQGALLKNANKKESNISSEYFLLAAHDVDTSDLEFVFTLFNGTTIAKTIPHGHQIRLSDREMEAINADINRGVKVTLTVINTALRSINNTLVAAPTPLTRPLRNTSVITARKGILANHLNFSF